MGDTADVIVVGAGVVGCSVAYYLAQNGAKVNLLERESIGSGASAHATGSLSILGAEFSSGPSFQFAILGYREFIGLVPQLESETGVGLMYQRRPSLRLALDKDEEELIKRMMEWQSELVSMRWIDGDEVRRIEPRLSTAILGAIYEDESAQLDSYRLNLALAQGAEHHGADIRLRQVTGLITEGSAVKGVRTSSGDIFADTVPGIEAGLRRRIDSGQLPPIDPAVTAQALAAMWQRVVTWWIEDPERATRRSVVETLVHLHPFSHLET